MCGLLHFGYFLQYFQIEFPHIAKEHFKDHFRNAFITSFFGIIALFVTILSGFTVYGLYPLHKIRKHLHQED